MEQALTEVSKYGGVLGPLLVLALLAIVGLYYHGRTLSDQLVQQRKDFQETLTELFEARIKESQASTQTIERVTAIMNDFARSLETRGQAIDRMVLLQDQIKSSIEVATSHVKSDIIRIETVVKEVQSCCREYFRRDGK